MLELNKNSYVTVSDADNYINAHYRSNNKLRKAWEGLDEADKIASLLSACADIEALPFGGRAMVAGQAMAFPRLPYQYTRAAEIPERVKHAQVEFALWQLDDTSTAQAEQRQALQAQGVESFSVGDLSESYTTGATAQPTALMCAKVANLLAPYRNGGRAIG